MKIKNELCEINISTENDFSFGDPKNSRYDVILNPDNYNNEDTVKLFVFDVDFWSKKKVIGLVAFVVEPEKNIAVLKGDVLTLLQNEKFLQIDLSSESIINIQHIDVWGSVFELIQFEEDYIVYGEVEIARFDDSLNKLWSFSGKDIFVSNSDKKSFEISGDRIKLYDFEGNYYEIDFDGRVLVS